MVRSTGCLICGATHHRIVESSGRYDRQTAGSSSHRFVILRSSNCSIVGSDCRIIGLSNRETVRLSDRHTVCRIVGSSDGQIVRESDCWIVRSSNCQIIGSSRSSDRWIIRSTEQPIVRLSYVRSPNRQFVGSSSDGI